MQMKSDVLKMPRDKYKKRLIIKLVACIALLVIALVLNICLSVLRTDQTHKAFLAVNIVFDVVAVWVVFTFVDVVLLPQFRRYKLLNKSDERGESIEGVVVSVEGAQRVQKTDCLTIELLCDGQTRKIFVIENTFESTLITGKNVTLTAVDNIAVACEVAE